jgi:hypothetical protein
LAGTSCSAAGVLATIAWDVDVLPRLDLLAPAGLLDRG